MGEIKSVKVDNWGVFFLQKLQNFFNKTDYCDLTLQFNDNSQLKVHRLVLSACTDFFNVLEQSCEMIDDVLIMPPELQADVVVPIVNFMYTGTLEFELIMYGRLLKTAKDMNMTVLLKLLEAHRRTMENKSQSIQKSAPKQVRRVPYNSAAKVVEERKYITQSQSTSTQQRRIPITSTVPKYKTLQIKPVSKNIFPRMLSEPAQILSKYPHSKTPVKGPSRFDCAEDTLPPETFEKSFDNISYESKPLICKEEPDAYDYDNLIRKHETYASPFEQLRRSYTNVNNKRPASSLSSYESPPEKKPNIQDVKEYAEQQRMRKQIAEEFDDDQEYDDILDDEFHNDDDDDEYIPPQSVRKQVKQQQQQFRAQQQAKHAEQQSKTSQQTIQIQKASSKSDNSPRATIVVKDSTSKSLNHAKVICEVLRKYPHIVKNNKSIKLKVMPQSNNSQKIVIKKEIDTSEAPVAEKQPAPVAAAKQPLPSTSTANTTPAAATQPRRIDSKTMHALIAMGAENKSGPWLCLRCGVNGRPISIPSYRGFRRHLINVHKEKIDARLCEHCGWRSTNNKDLAHHLLVEHSVKTSSYNFPKCEYCTEICIDYDTLNKHITEKHSVKKEPQACIYCNVSFSEEMQLYTHMRSFHKQRAIEDGVLDFSDEEISIGEASEMTMQEQVSNDSRINIISDISLSKNIPIIQTAIPANASTITIQSVTEATPMNAASLNIIENTTEEESQILANEYIGTDSSQGPKFINAQGTEMDLTPAQREEIISQLDQQHDGIVMVLNEEPFDANVATSARTTQNNVENATSREPVADNSMFIVCGQEPDMDNEISMPASLDRAKSKSKDPLEWVEEEIASHTDSVDKETKNDENENEIAKDASEEDTQEKSPEPEPVVEAKDKEKEEKKDESSSSKIENDKPAEDTLEMKLKLLTDWTDDEEEEEESISDKEKASQSAAEEEKITSEEILFKTLSQVDQVPEDRNKEDNEKEKTPEAEVQMKGEVEDDDGEKPQEGDADVEKEENTQKEASPAPKDDKEEVEELKNEEEEIKDEAEEIKDEIKEESQEEAAEEQEPLAPKEKSSEDYKKENSKKDSEEVASTSKGNKERTLITRAELRNIMSDWGDDEEEEV